MPQANQTRLPTTILNALQRIIDDVKAGKLTPTDAIWLAFALGGGQLPPKNSKE